MMTIFTKHDDDNDDDHDDDHHQEAKILPRLGGTICVCMRLFLILIICKMIRNRENHHIQAMNTIEKTIIKICRKAVCPSWILNHGLMVHSFVLGAAERIDSTDSCI